MANTNFRRGLVPRNLNFSRGVHYYRAGTGDDIFLGAPVAISAAGLCVPSAATSAGAVASIGVAVGFIDGNKAGLAADAPFLDVSTLGSNPQPYVAVADDPVQEFIVQEDTGGTALTQADVGLLGMLVFSADGASATSGNTTTGWSLLEFDRSTAVTTNSAQFQVLSLLDGVNEDGTLASFGNYAKLVVRIVHHQKNIGIVPIPGPGV